MPKSYLYVMDPIDSINPRTDTTYAFMRESQSLGVDNWYCRIEDLVVSDGAGFAYAHRVKLPVAYTGNQFFELGEYRPVPFHDFNVIWMRKDPPVDHRFLAATMILDCHDSKRTLMMNNPTSLRVANEKLFGTLFPELMPRTVVSSNPRVIFDAVVHFEQGVLKPIFGAGGSGIMVFKADDRNLRSAIDILSEEGKRPVMVQEYLPAAREGDKRIIVLGGKAIGAILRVPKENDHRANIHVGGTVQKAEITGEEHAMVATLAPKLKELGLHFVGLDVIGGKITEINVTSPTGVQEIDRLDARTGADRIPAQVMKYVDGLVTLLPR
jgi:glutathione synthase